MTLETILKENETIILNNLYYFNNNIEKALQSDDFAKVNQYTISMNLYISNLRLLGVM